MTATENVTDLPRRSGKPTEDIFELHKSGTVRANIDTQTYNLKRPKLGEFRGLRESFQALAEQAQANKDAETPVDQSGEIIDWLRQVFDVLADRALPESDDDLPTWFLDSTLPATLIGHWRAAPLARGGL